MSTRRPIPIALTALVAFFSALAALGVSNGMNMAQAQGTPMAMTVTTQPSALLTTRAVAFRMDMRKLWEDHITWTRLAIISLTTGAPDTEATVARLLRNQADIGNAIKPYYGRSAGTELTRLLRAHILIAADVIAAAKAGDKVKLADAQRRWVANADQIAAFLHAANPEQWPQAAIKAEMHRHLALTAQEAVARIKHEWAADVAAYDRVHRHILHMADMLSGGIIEQFPARFR
jgi:hypothetical protein